MEPIYLIIALTAILAIVVGFVAVRRSGRGELQEPPPFDPSAAPPHDLGTGTQDRDELRGPEVDVVDPVSGVLPPEVVITGP